jgi:hypothetical protein
MASEKLTLKDILGAVDLNAKTVWDELSEDQRKSVVFFTLNRYISNVQGNRELQEHFLLNANVRFNKNFYEVYKHHKLLWQLACSCSDDSGKVHFHPWLKLKQEKNKRVDFLMKIFPDMKKSDLETLSEITTDKEIKQHLENMGWSKKEIDGIKL